MSHYCNHSDMLVGNTWQPRWNDLPHGVGWQTCLILSLGNARYAKIGTCLDEIRNVDRQHIIIYAAKPEYAALRRFVAKHTPAVSAISYVKELGYHKLTDGERQELEAFFAAAPILPLSATILDQAVRLRQQKKMTLGDSLVGVTAIVYNLTLVTRNTTDFDWIDGLSLLNPFESLP